MVSEALGGEEEDSSVDAALTRLEEEVDPMRAGCWRDWRTRYVRGREVGERYFCAKPAAANYPFLLVFFS